MEQSKSFSVALLFCNPVNMTLSRLSLVALKYLFSNVKAILKSTNLPDIDSSFMRSKESKWRPKSIQYRQHLCIWI